VQLAEKQIKRYDGHKVILWMICAYWQDKFCAKDKDKEQKNKAMLVNGQD
jgi:hypothetical protein